MTLSAHPPSLPINRRPSTCVILQPSYIPWRGYFHQIQRADVFVFYDDVQYDKHGWRNRNLIKGPQGPQWLTIPVKAKGVISEHRTICEVPILWEQNWPQKHFRSWQNNYARAPYFNKYLPLLNSIYERRDQWLVDFTVTVTITLARELGITHTQFVRSSELGIGGGKSERLAAITRSVGATHYLSGPSARDYLDTAVFEQAGLTVEFMNYDYPDYAQLYPPFAGGVSVLDLMMQLGPQAGATIWGDPPAQYKAA